MTAAPGPLEREVRRFVVGGLLFVSFLAGAALVDLNLTTRWAVAQSEERLVAEVRAIGARVEGAGESADVLTADPLAVRLLHEFGPQQAAVFDPGGVLLQNAAFLPDAARVPDRLPAADRPVGGAAQVTRFDQEGRPAVSVAIPIGGGRRILRAVYDATPLFAAERTVRILTVVVPAGVALLVFLVIPSLRRLARPMDALAETARTAEAFVPRGEGSGQAPDDAVAAFARTIEELRARTGELEALRRREQERADALAITAETLVRSHPGGLLVVGANGTLTEANGPALAALDLSRDALGGPASERLADWPVLAKAVAAALAGTPTLAAEAVRGEATGARLLAVTAVPVVDAAGRTLGGLVFLEDRTAVTRLERELAARRQLAALGEMSAGIAHEFRNATLTILGYARLAAAEADAEARARHLAGVRAEAEHVVRVTGDFLLFARPERLVPGPVDLGELVADVLAEERMAARETELVQDGSYGEAVVDAALVRRALVNLVRNAREAAETGEGPPRVRVTGERPPDGSSVLRIEDSGPGVPPEAARTLFVPFASTKKGGTGLGLSLVAKILDLHGGAVAVGRSDTLGGASFVVTLPPAPRA